MAFKPKNQGNSYDGPKILWDEIVEATEEEVYDARVALVVDLGVQERGSMVAYKEKTDVTYVATEEELDELLDQAEVVLGDGASKFMTKHELYPTEEESTVEVDSEKFAKELAEKYGIDAEVGDTVYKVDFRIVELKDANMVTYALDLVEHYVNYTEDSEPRQYRHWLHKRDYTTKEAQGFALSVVPPMKKDGIWTYAPTSMHVALAKACGCVDELTKDNDVSCMLGYPLAVAINKNEGKNGKSYIKDASPADLQKLSKKQLAAGVEELDITPQAISFEDATVEALEIAMPNSAVISKIKKAKNYEGSQMQKALEEWEAKRKAGSKKPKKASEDGEEDSNADPQGSVEDDSTEAEEATEAPKKASGRKPRGKATEAKAEDKPKATGRKARSKPEPEEEAEDSDLPW